MFKLNTKYYELKGDEYPYRNRSIGSIDVAKKFIEQEKKSRFKIQCSLFRKDSLIKSISVIMNTWNVEVEVVYEKTSLVNFVALIEVSGKESNVNGFHESLRKKVFGHI